MANLDPRFAAAIARIESGGKYDLTGPATKSGDRAYGKYQVMGSNIPDWTQAATGTAMSPQDFLNSPEAQDAVFQHRFGSYADKYGPTGAAKAWFAGENGMNNPNASDGNTTVANYGSMFNKYAGLTDPQDLASAKAALAPQDDGDKLPPGATPAQFSPQALAAARAQMSPGADFGSGLVNAGAALQSVYNPFGASALTQLAKNSMAAQMASRPTFGQIGEDAFGQKQFGWIDPNKQTTTPANSAGVAGGGAAGSLQDVAAKIEAMNANGASMDEKLAQVPAGFRADLKAMLNNAAMPTNLTRSGPMRNALLTLAHAADPSFDESALPGRIKYQRDLASNSATTAGGQKVLLGTSLEHLLPLSQSAVDLNNSNGATGLAPEAQLENSVKNLTTANAAKVTALENNADRYSGEVGKLYSGNQGGGVHERQESRNRYSGSLPPQQLAAALETDLGLMLGKTSELEKQYRDVMGKDPGSTFIGPDRQKMIDQVRSNIAALRGLKGSAASPGGNKPTLDSIFAQ